ncbi:hypothetical protein SAMN04488100_10766 [Alkalibacterium putridalgicola]|uniref:Yip1 domain-containing protein n=1 Tax=Alkalibacterium putridalgicola TaxID=426703 RepID=A0A1H7S9N8_9LACT|nr:hypothetical protein [Alkalibacterium putridalgicola]GEK89116.1 hypothetical protein APU01nite_11550 [Alkalibacterium putridalgicola]SEL69203.1 hypothetical protein SAMN04488100_10766 [Alkalibacterium putridalgicola]
MNENVTNNKKRFPWLALAVFSVVLLTSILINFSILDISAEPEVAELFEMNPGMRSFGLIFGAVIGLISGLLGVGFQYLVTKFPTQWIAKDTHVYKNEIWSALFYSSAIGIILELLAALLNFQGNIVFSILVSIFTTALFLFFYISGENKPQHIKKAITIVSVVIAGMDIILTTGAL